MPTTRTTPAHPRSGRTLRWMFVVLLVVSAAQVGWWMLDQRWFTDEVHGEIRDLHAAQGTLDASVEARLAEERRSRMNQYLWEGGFFLAVLLGGIGVIARAVRRDTVLRRRQETFLAAVSHELRSPLASARVAAETISLRDPPAAERRAQIDRVLRSVDRLDAMITNLLDTVRLEEGEFVLKLENVDLLRALEPVQNAFADRAGQEGIEFRPRLEAGLAVRADVAALRAVARNLLENAFKAVEDAEVPEVEICASAEGGTVLIDVIDNGVGFDPSHAAALFEKFHRPGNALRRGGRGAGLGLYLVAQIAARSGARVEAYSEGPGTGARFRVLWPLAEGSV